MKKILLASVFVIAGSLVGFAQSVDKALHNGKWYANAELGSNKITLSKNAAAANVFDIELTGETSMNYGSTPKTDFVNNEGGYVKAGTYYVERGFGYKINGNSFSINELTYNVTAQKNGDLLLILITPANKNTK